MYVSAALKHNLTSGATDQEIDARIERWLYVASDSDGFRREDEKRGHGDRKNLID